jgi:hypothetical protein
MISRRQLLELGCVGAGLALVGRPRPTYAQQAKVASPARLSGTVRWAGRASRPAKLRLTGGCAYCRGFDIRAEDLLQAAGGALRNAVVFLEGVARGKPLPTGAPTIAELRCSFVPHVLTVCAGQKVLLDNQDPILNTFHAVEAATGKTLFNIGMPNRQRLLRRIPRAGAVKMLCDVHPWELGWVVAFDHPYHAVTDARGGFLLDGIPPGRYTLGLWHERLGGRRQPVVLGAGERLRVELVFPA